MCPRVFGLEYTFEGIKDALTRLYEVPNRQTQSKTGERI